MKRQQYKTGDPMITKHADVWDETDKQGVKHHHERSRFIYTEECGERTSDDFNTFMKISTLNFLRVALLCGGTATLISLLNNFIG